MAMSHERWRRVEQLHHAALVRDLEPRGPLGETPVVWAAEFGRTWDIGNGDGRDHHTAGSTIWLAAAAGRG